MNPTYIKNNFHDQIACMYFAMYNVLLCIMHTHISGPNFQEKIFPFNFLIQFTYLYLETKLIIIFQFIILHSDIITAF